MTNRRQFLKACTALAASLPAAPALAIDNNYQAAVDKIWRPKSALSLNITERSKEWVQGMSFMLFTLIYTPCLSVIATIQTKSKSTKFMWLSIVWSLGLALVRGKAACFCISRVKTRPT